MYICLGLIILLISVDTSNCNRTIEYFAVDLDETFFVKDKATFEENIKSFKKLVDSGVKPFFCTGRVYSSAMAVIGEDFFEKTGYNGYPGVYANGAVVYDSDGNIISQNNFTEEFLKKFAEHIVTNGIDDVAIFNEENNFYILKDLREGFDNYPKEKRIAKLYKISSDDLAKKKIVIIIINDDVNIPELNGQYVDKKSTNNGTHYITAKNATKDEGLKKLLGHLHIEHDKCAFIGDGDNDVEIIKMCKHSYAVGNAVQAVKDNAKTVLDKNFDQGAFVDAVDMFLKDTCTQGSTVDLGVAC